MASGSKRFLQLMFGIGGKLDSSFKGATGEAKKDLSDLEKAARKSAVSEAARMRDFKKNWGEARGQAGEFSANMGRAFGQVTSAAKLALAAVGSLTAGLGIYGLVQKTADIAEDAHAMQTRYGIDPQSYLTLAHAAKLAGVTNEEYGKSYRFLSKNMALAIQGNKEAQFAFARAGVTLKDSKGKIKSVDEVMLQMSDTFAKMPEGVHKGNLAMAVFGKRGQSMALMMQQGSKEIKRLQDEAKQLNLAPNDKEIADFEAYNYSMRELQDAGQGFMMKVGAKLAPVLTDINKRIFDWYLANKKVIDQNLDDFVKWLSENVKYFMKEVLPGLVEWVKNAAIAANNFANYFGGWIPLIKKVVIGFLAWKAVMAAFYVIMAGNNLLLFGKTILTVAGNLGVLRGVLAGSGYGQLFMMLFNAAKFAFTGIAGLIRMVGAAMMANPILLVIGAIIFALYALYANWDKVTGYFKEKISEIKKAFEGGFIKGIITTWLNFNPITLIMDTLRGLAKWLIGEDNYNKGVAYIQSWVTGAISIAKSADEWVRGAFASFVKWLIGEENYNKGIAFIQNFLIGALEFAKSVPGMLFDALVAPLKWLIGEENYDKGKQFIGNWLSGAWDWLKSEGAKLKDAIWNILPNWAQKAITGGAKFASDAATQVKGAFTDFSANRDAAAAVQQAAPATRAATNAAPAVAAASKQGQQGGAATSAPSLAAMAAPAAPVNTSNYSFAPVITISSGTDPSVVRKAIDDALKQAQDQFKAWTANAQYQAARVAMK